MDKASAHICCRPVKPQATSHTPTRPLHSAPHNAPLTIHRSKLDKASDRQFYSFPRFVKHVDEGFLAQVTQLYRERIPEGA